jgi:D-amino-acid dehydrogenase
MPRTVAILGAGVVGLTAALHCARRGMRVRLVERAPRRRDGCSFGNAGMVVPSHFVPLAAPGMVALGLKWMWNPESPFRIRPRLDPALLSWGLRFCRASTRRRAEAAAPVLRDLSLLSRRGFEEIGLDIGLVRRGLLMLCKTEQALEEEVHLSETARRLGIPTEVLDARGLAALDPWASLDVVGGVHFPQDCHLPPRRYLEALEAELARLGVEMLWETEFLGAATEGDRLRALETTRGPIEADEFVLCAGVWSDRLSRALGLRLPMEAGKGYSLTLAEPRQLPELCSICVEARLAVTPMDGALRVGGTMELSGLDERVDARRVRAIVRAFAEYFPAFSEDDFAGIEPWAGLRPVSPDGLPYLGRTRRWDNLVVATGHAMLGLSLAPATGQIVAGLLEGEAPPLDLALLSPDRFG